MLNKPALAIATIVGTILQVAMVVLGHSNAPIARVFAVGGMAISLIAGLLYTWFRRGGATSGLLVGGLIAGGACAFVGILVSYLLGDVPPSLLLLGTASSMVTGMLGAWFGKVLTRATVIGIIGLVALAGPEASVAQAVDMASEVGTSSAQQTPARDAVRRAALDYLERFYEGDSAKIVRSVRPD